MILTKENILSIFNDVRYNTGQLIFIDQLLVYMNRYMKEGGLFDTIERTAYFIGQVGVESDRLRATTEYASGEAYDISVNRAKAIELGNTAAGDGPRYKGRGLIQTTGRANYARLEKELDLPYSIIDYPGELAMPDLAVKSAVWYWNNKKLSTYADKPNDWMTTKTTYKGKLLNKGEYITYLINGGLSHLEERMNYTQRAFAVLQKG